MKIQRLGLLAGVALVGSLALSACGSDNNAGTAGAVRLGGSAPPRRRLPQGGTLNAEGSSAQKNAIEEAITSFQDDVRRRHHQLQPDRLRRGHQAVHRRPGRLRRLRLGAQDRAEKDGKVEAAEAAKRCGSPAWNLPDGHRPDRDRLQRQGRRQARADPRGRRQHLQRQDHHLERPGHRQAQHGRRRCRATPIKVFFRSDESGTTENFTKYLKAAAPDAWTAEPGKKWTGKGEGKEKSAGVAERREGHRGGITYVEWSYAKDNELGIAQVDNGGGAGRADRASRVGKAVAAAKPTAQGNDLRLKLDYATKEAGAYPIVLVTYEIVCSKGPDAEPRPTLVKAFLKHFASDDVQKGLEEIGYAPLPGRGRAPRSRPRSTRCPDRTHAGGRCSPAAGYGRCTERPHRPARTTRGATCHPSPASPPSTRLPGPGRPQPAGGRPRRHRSPRRPALRRRWPRAPASSSSPS